MTKIGEIEKAIENGKYEFEYRKIKKDLEDLITLQNNDRLQYTEVNINNLKENIVMILGKAIKDVPSEKDKFEDTFFPKDK